MIEKLIEKFGINTIENTGFDGTGKLVFEIKNLEKLVEICQFVHDEDGFYFDSLSNLTGLDNGSEKNTMEVIYHLYSIPYNHFMVLKVVLNRDSPVLPTVSSVWASANWSEREAFDLLGIKFINHPDLRRILMPEDWVGFPLRKDYKTQENYHGIKVDF